jgi:hypothetical protein
LQQFSQPCRFMPLLSQRWLLNEATPMLSCESKNGGIGRIYPDDATKGSIRRICIFTDTSNASHSQYKFAHTTYSIYAIINICKLCAHLKSESLRKLWHEPTNSGTNCNLDAASWPCWSRNSGSLQSSIINAKRPFLRKHGP